MADEERVILVDAHDGVLGSMEKMQAHVEGVRHRAVSGFLFSPSGDLLMQKRASGKYHSGALWANTCCSHPWPSESVSACMQRRFREELGISPDCHWFGTMQYRCDIGRNLIEDEFVHGFAGVFQEKVTMNAEEVEDWRWVSREDLATKCKQDPASIAPWLRIYQFRGIVDLAWASCKAIA